MAARLGFAQRNDFCVRAADATSVAGADDLPAARDQYASHPRIGIAQPERLARQCERGMHRMEALEATGTKLLQTIVSNALRPHRRDAVHGTERPLVAVAQIKSIRCNNL